jgi:hypothetical protein
MAFAPVQHDLLLLGAGMALMLLLVAGALWAWHLHVRRVTARRRAAGYQLMDCLKAYSAWMDWQREEPIHEHNLDELSSPPALMRASEIKDRWFPELSSLMVRLLQSHRLMVEYMWEQNILRMSGGGATAPAGGARRLRELRDLQDATLDSLFLRCRQLIGESDLKWHRTRSDFSFSSSLNASTPGHA